MRMIDYGLWPIIQMLLLIFLPAGFSAATVGNEATAVVRPQEYERALKNPLKGFRAWKCDNPHKYGTLLRVYLKWNELERSEQDGTDRIKAVCDKEWRDVEKHNIKVIPRVYLHWSENKKYWPDDMQEGDYDSNQFRKRLLRLISRLGECWDNDPRIAWVEMGIIGKWGEQHSPMISPEMQKIMGDAFTRVFKNKMTTVRHPWDFQGYNFGIYWDSWAHIQQMDSHGREIEKLGNRWQTRPIDGECAYNWGRWKVQPGDSPSDTLRDRKHRAYLINSIRRLHCNNLGMAEYDAADSDVLSGAEEVQKAFGYRFVIEEVRYQFMLQRGDNFDVTFRVRNIGSSPFYGNWPVEISLLDPKTRAVVWSDTFKTVDIQQWLPGDHWDEVKQAYENKPRIYTAQGNFHVPQNIGQGKYILSLAILDPAGMLPSVRFAIRNYFQGGRHPIGLVGIGVPVENFHLNPDLFDDPAQDSTLHYILNNQAD